MKFRLLFNQEYPCDFNADEKSRLERILVEIPNSSCREYEIDTKYINAFDLYKLLVHFGFIELKLKPVVRSGNFFGIFEMSKLIEFDDEIILELTDYDTYSKFFLTNTLTLEI